MSDRGPREPGWGVPRELLLILGDDGDGDGDDGDDTGVGGGAAASAVLERVAEWGQVTARFPPRLALVLLPAERVADARALRGVRGVFAGDVPEELAGTLRAAERLFVDGWLARAQAKPPRAGDGRSWEPPT
ncbi:hypothetical protein UG55_1005146 [Frankia sp. EI5c]|uniref:hypothetical protein n=1 Tax=Frankia sp. EI5c TaxID=683316 RepID=UPI0007C34E9F|nr:hypothetical protein [Frankia sp. EI5c]OAA28632.1 hypothetical protein UG55_1005146 [Frankia sp. EI5c]